MGSETPSTLNSPRQAEDGTCDPAVLQDELEERYEVIIPEPVDSSGRTANNADDPDRAVTTHGQLTSSHVPPPIDDLPTFCSKLLGKAQRLLTRETFIGLILLYGSIPLSCLQFLMVSSLVSVFTATLLHKSGTNDNDADFQFVCGLSKVRYSVFPFVVDNLLPTTINVKAFAGYKTFKPTEAWLSPETTTAELPDLIPLREGSCEPGTVRPSAGSPQGNEPEQNEDIAVHLRHEEAGHGRQDRTTQQERQAAATKQHVKDCLFAAPSSWGRYDIANPSFLAHLIDQQRLITSDEEDCERSFANSQMLRNHSTVISRDRSLWIQEDGKTLCTTANMGDIISIASFHSTGDSADTDLLSQTGWVFENNISRFDASLSAIWNAGSKRSPEKELDGGILPYLTRSFQNHLTNFPFTSRK